ncbi:MAG: MGDG synthase family glycosyltransferase [Acetivibrionales bacterium]
MKKILIPMVEAGGGHRMPALAIKDSIEELYPGKYQIDVIDFAREAGAKWDDKIIKGIWDWALARPELTTNLNILLDSFNHITRSNTVMKLFFQQFVRKGIKYILDYKPDIVFSTHFFCSSVALFARDRYRLPYKIFSYMTDPVRGHNLWVNPRIEAVIVSTKEAKEYLIKQGEPQNKVKVMPFPLQKKFFIEPVKTREEILTELGLDLSRKTLLATSGGQGIGDTSEYVKDLYKNNFSFNIIAICGKNKELFEELNRLKSGTVSETPMTVLGFVDNMHELLEASDLAIAKGGASTTLEVLVKHVPTIFTHCAALHEKGNIDFCVNNKMGWFAKDKNQFQAIINDILNTNILERYKNNIKENEYVKTLPDATKNIARFIVKELENPYVKRKISRKTRLRAIVLGIRINIFRIKSRTKNKRYKVDR